MVKNIYPEGGTFAGILGHMPFLLKDNLANMEQSRKPLSIFKFMVHFTYGLNVMALLIKAAWLCGLEVFQRIQRNVFFQDGAQDSVH